MHSSHTAARCICKTEGFTKLSENWKKAFVSTCCGDVTERNGFVPKLTRVGVKRILVHVYWCCGVTVDSLQKQGARCDILKSEVIFHLLHGALIQTSWISCNILREQNFVPQQNFFAKMGKPHKENCRWNMFLFHVPATCSLVCHIDECASKQRWKGYFTIKKPIYTDL